MGLVDLCNVKKDIIIKFKNQQIDMMVMVFLIYPDKCSLECTIDDDGQIKKLRMVGDSVEPFALPAIIVCLEELAELTLGLCQYLPRCNFLLYQICKRLYMLYNCKYLLDNNFPVQMVFSNLKK
jgi:hypothetical protein